MISEDVKQTMIQFADNFFGEYSLKQSASGDKIIPKLCPLCHGGSSGKDKNTFALFLDNGMFVCKRGSCGRHGRFEELAKEISGEEISIHRSNKPNKSDKQYVLPSVEVYEPTKEIYDYMKLRGISKETVDALRIGSDKEGNIVFRFYLDGEDVYHKFRKPKKLTPDESRRKEWQESGTKPILYNMDNTTFNEPLIICEGECDCAALYEAGLTNVVSVPSGVDNNDWISLCYDWLERFRTIILFGDNDVAGKRGVENWIKRLGEYRVLVVRDYPEVPNSNPVTYCKDANEILLRYGESKLLEMVDSAEEIQTKGLIRVADIIPIDPTKIPRIKTNIPTLDDAIGGLAEGCVTVFTGASGNGKSTLSGLILLNAIEQGVTCTAYSGELSAGLFQEWITLQAAGSEWIGLKWDPIRGRNIPFVAPEVQRRIMDWCGDRLLLYDNNEQFADIKQVDAIINVFTQAARKYNSRLYLIDNMMTSVSDTDDEWRAQAMFVNAIKRFATHYQAHVMLVCHPRKTKKGEAITNADVSGSSSIINLCDNAIVIKRPDIEITKNRLDGRHMNIECCYAGDSRRIYQADKGDLNKFSWDKSGLTPPSVRADSMPEYGIQLSSQDPRQPF